MKLIFHDIQQGTEEWFSLREGKLTASIVKPITTGKGLGKGADTLSMQIAYERTTNFETERFSSVDTERGNEYEPVAIKAYELKSVVKVDNGGFFSIGDLGVSPDGLIGKDGLAEVKCPAYKNHMRVLKSKQVDPQYIPQIQFQLMVTGRKWCDFISYNKNMPKGKTLIIIRVYPDKEYHELLNKRITALRLMIKGWIKILTE